MQLNFTIFDNERNFEFKFNINTSFDSSISLHHQNVYLNTLVFQNEIGVEFIYFLSIFVLIVFIFACIRSKEQKWYFHFGHLECDHDCLISSNRFIIWIFKSKIGNLLFSSSLQVNLISGHAEFIQRIVYKNV